MKYQDIDAIHRLCNAYGVVEVIAAVQAHTNDATTAVHHENPEAIVHQYAPVVNAALVQLVNIRNARIGNTSVAS